MNYPARIRTPIWPYLALVACLFTLTLLAPRSWESVAIRQFKPEAERELNFQPLAPAPPAHTLLSLPLAAGEPAPAAQDLKRSQPREALHQPPPVPDPAERPKPELQLAELQTVQKPAAEERLAEEQMAKDQPVEEQPAQQQPAEEQQSTEQQLAEEQPASLDDFDSPSQTAEVAPPVAERIELDRSIAETPALPAADQEDEEEDAPPEIWLPRRKRHIEPNVVKSDRSVEEDAAQPKRVWPAPVALIDQVESLERTELTGDWIDEVLGTLHRITEAERLTAPSVANDLETLDRLAGQAGELAEQAPHGKARSQLLRAGYALERRLAVWHHVHQLAPSLDREVPVSLSYSDLQPSLEQAQQRLSGGGDREAWRQYLMLDQLERLEQSGDPERRRKIAREVLRRMGSSRLNRSHDVFLEEPPFSELQTALRRWADEPVDHAAVLENLEAYEASRHADDAHLIADHYRTVRWSSDPTVTELAETLNKHYRNANFRVALGSELVNRLIPDPEPVTEPVENTILGAYVSGTSQTSAQLRVLLIPDESQWNIGVEAEGEVETDTIATKGPAVFYNQGLARFLARKLLLVDRRGIRTRLAEAGAHSASALQALETEFDSVPLLSWFARGIVLQQHQWRYDEAQQEAACRVEQRAGDRLDQEIHARLEKVESGFQQQVLEPLDALRLEPVALDMQTTDQRLIVRYRLAGDRQLAAHTPRPQAPGDSLLSVQLNETAANNTLEQLELGGRRSDLRSLFRDLADTFGRDQWEGPEDLPEDVIIEFAKRDPVRVTFDQGRAVVTLRIAELKSRGRKRWRNFAVRAFYLPDSSQLQANLVRDDVIRLPEGRLRLGDQIALRGIFSKVFSKSRPINLINRTIAEHDALSDLQVTQFLIKDGWVAMALGPQRGGAMQHLAREPKETKETKR